MRDKIRRVRRESVYDEWPQCFCCGEHFHLGYELFVSNPQSVVGDTIGVCDNCLKKAKQSPIGFCIDGEIKDGSLPEQIPVHQQPSQ